MEAEAIERDFLRAAGGHGPVFAGPAWKRRQRQIGRAAAKVTARYSPGQHGSLNYHQFDDALIPRHGPVFAGPAWKPPGDATLSGTPGVSSHGPVFAGPAWKPDEVGHVVAHGGRHGPVFAGPAWKQPLRQGPRAQQAGHGPVFAGPAWKLSGRAPRQRDHGGHGPVFAGPAWKPDRRIRDRARGRASRPGIRRASMEAC